MTNLSERGFFSPASLANQMNAQAALDDSTTDPVPEAVEATATEAT